MISDYESAALDRRAQELTKRLRRHNLVFVHCGPGFSCFHGRILEHSNHVRVAGQEAVDAPITRFADTPTVVISSLEDFADTGTAGGRSLGQLRVRVDELLDRDTDVLLLSTRARSSFTTVPGSSLIEDASVYCLPLLEEEEVADEAHNEPGRAYPDIGVSPKEVRVEQIFRLALLQLGTGTLTALDHLIFDARLYDDLVTRLDPRDLDAMRSAGFVQPVGSSLNFAFPDLGAKFRDALADVLASVVRPTTDLPSVSSGLWLIERTLRRALRDAALEAYGFGWRKQTLHGNLNQKVLDRARYEVSPTAASVSELRDPIEWLSLGELLEVIESAKFGGLAFSTLTWQRFKAEVLPVRNRLSHMRLLKRGDRDAVAMWANQVERSFKSKS